ncbi:MULTISPECIES: hypothetical protein [unclassified Lentimonas]|uniref:hypothetical protein n=1 Tax=unclassified Lentimonas TaxID=2630993 RepID=UPI0013245678|nr:MULTISPECIES: hypothetical protein [unclassified Lentimonas]CAA6677408.1 Unannotated [Lentimonas sp. CC4]CAA6686953.1 Unannotated [Lentimonas sp. CC6]CAA6690139.1 Unannotated [Lentimonas sp. CC19]CAA6690899.1 Unannotated [Lentimonas sp. CC10]CAA7070749.1 Unannotated [Lentimonas sp. CC11]
MKKIKALIYAALGFMMSLSAFRQENYLMAAGILFFVGCAIAITLTSIGRLQITWDELGVTISKKPKPPILLQWTDMQKLKVDHLGYHVITRQTNFRISKDKMPKELLKKIRSSIRENKAATS